MCSTQLAEHPEGLICVSLLRSYEENPRAGWPLPACGEPMRIKPDEIVKLRARRREGCGLGVLAHVTPYLAQPSGVYEIAFTCPSSGSGCDR